MPDEADRKIIDDIIFNELYLGISPMSPRDAYVRAIDKLKADGCDAVAPVHGNPAADHTGHFSAADP